MLWRSVMKPHSLCHRKGAPWVVCMLRQKRKAAGSISFPLTRILAGFPPLSASHRGSTTCVITLHKIRSSSLGQVRVPMLRMQLWVRAACESSFIFMALWIFIDVTPSLWQHSCDPASLVDKVPKGVRRLYSFAPWFQQKYYLAVWDSRAFKKLLWQQLLLYFSNKVKETWTQAT